ncbi:hypothetical protein BPC006_I0593 [Burkholderia pseudomallei BPC006]|nr:hypothetical protein BPC006_I0593 [Burkholderia pseudomallei BPC006]
MGRETTRKRWAQGARRGEQTPLLYSAHDSENQ